MEDFKKLPKMQHFKEGGGVKDAYCMGGKAKAKYKAGGEVSHDDIKEDKKLIKKAFKMHDDQEHGGEHTDLSKLRKGGRAKKEKGTVRKYKTGGTVENVYGAKKEDKDLKNIANTKRIKPAALCEGKSVKKYNGGGLVPGMGVSQASGPMGVTAPGAELQPGRAPTPRVGYKAGGKAKKATGGLIEKNMSNPTVDSATDYITRKAQK